MNLWTLTRGLLVVCCAALGAASGADAAPLNPGVEISAMSCPALGSCTLAGGYADGLRDGQGLLISERGGAWRRAVEAPLPADASLDPLNPSKNTGVTDIDCAAVGDCTAVGVYTDRTNNNRGLLLTERDGRWARGVAAKLPRNAQPPAKSSKSTGDNLVLLSDACVSAGSCYAVGNYVTNANTLQGLIITQRHGKWQRGIVAPLPPGATVRGQRAGLYEIVCLPSGDCTATGAYVDSNGAQQAMLLSESGGVWRAATEASLPAGAGSNPQATPIAVDCVAEGSCTVAGNYQDGRDNSLGVLLSENNGSWAPGTGATLPANAAPPTSYNAQTTVIASVGCVDAADCSAVGYYTDDNGNTQALLLGETDGSWGAGQEVALPSNATRRATAQTAGLDAVACPALGDCVAGGFYTDTAGNDDSLLVTQSGGAWSPGVAVALPRGAGRTQYSAIDSISCASAGNCVAIGTYNDRYGDTLGFSIAEQDGVWGRALELPSPVASGTEIKLSVKALLKPAGKLATVAAIRKAGAFELPYVIFEPGRLTVSWYELKGKARVLVASGRIHSKAAATGSLKLSLTRAGRRLFKTTGKLDLTATAVLDPKRGRPISDSGQFTLG